jgi:hypothetical protein
VQPRAETTLGMNRLQVTPLARFDYLRDDTQRRIRVTARESLQAADVMAVIDRQALEKAWAYGLLYDVRAVHIVAPRRDAGRVAQYVQSYVRVHGARGPVALVTRQTDILETGQLYASLGAKVGFEFKMFGDLAEAERWLDARSSPQP